MGETARQKLQTYSWPGNVRELDNMMQRALILADGEVIEESALHFENISSFSAPVEVEPQPHADSLNGDLKQREYDLIIDALKAGSRQAAAEKLGISPRTLRYKVAKMREEGVEINV